MIEALTATIEDPGATFEALVTSAGRLARVDEHSVVSLRQAIAEFRMDEARYEDGLRATELSGKAWRHVEAAARLQDLMVEDLDCLYTPELDRRIAVAESKRVSVGSARLGAKRVFSWLRDSVLAPKRLELELEALGRDSRSAVRTVDRLRRRIEAASQPWAGSVRLRSLAMSLWPYLVVFLLCLKIARTDTRAVLGRLATK